MNDDFETLIKENKILIFDGISPPPIAKEIYDTFCKLGAHTTFLNPSQFKKSKTYKIERSFIRLTKKKEYYYHPKYTKDVSRAIRKISPDIILVVGFSYSHINRKTLLKLKKELGFKLFLWDTESGNMLSNIKKLDFYLKNEIPLYDRVFSFSKSLTTYMNGLGHENVSFLPYGLNPIEQDTGEKKSNDLLFVCTPNIRRLHFLEKLKNHDLKVHGKYWKRYTSIMSKQLSEKMSYEDIWSKELYKLVARSKIILNINSHLWSSFESGVNLRIFETLALKGFLLTDYCEELNDVFKLGHEIETFKTSEEMIDKIDYYLKHDNERKQIAKNGHARFMKDYTWEARLKLFAKQLQTAKP